MGQANTPYKRERIPASRLEMDMLEYQLKEAKKQLEVKTAESERLSALLNSHQEMLDRHIQRSSHMTRVNVELLKKVALCKIAAIVEAAVIVMLILTVLGVV